MSGLQENVMHALHAQKPEWKVPERGEGEDAGWTRTVMSRTVAHVSLWRLRCPKKDGTRGEKAQHEFIEDWQEELPTVVLVENSGKVTCTHCRDVLGTVNLNGDCACGQGQRQERPER